MCSAGSEVVVGRPKAFLVDVYETILTCDFEVLWNELPVIAGAEPRLWRVAFTRIVPDLTHGRLTMAQGFEHDQRLAEPRGDHARDLRLRMLRAA